MDATQWIVAVVAALSFGALGFGAGRWRYGRREHTLLQRAARIEQARQLALQHGQQARRQIEMLQKEIATYQRARVEAQAARRRSRELSDTLDAQERTMVMPGRGFDLSRLPPSGFADTQPI